MQSAYAWCLIDLVKRHAVSGDGGRMAEFVDRLAAFQVPEGNDLLAEHRQKALALTRRERRAVMEARKLGKDGQHEQAIRILADLQAKGELQDEDKVSYGWEIHHAIRDHLRTAAADQLAPATVAKCRRHLNDYLKLGIAGPELLHSLILQQALRLASHDHLRLVAFLQLWKLEHLRPDDFEGRKTGDGKVYPSLAEGVARRACHEALASKRRDEMQFLLPFVQRVMESSPDNVWLQLDTVKLLRELGRTGEARALATDFARKKASEYWTWELLGDLESDVALRLSCYATALTCSQDDNFVSKVRLKFAEIVSSEHPNEARFEVERVLAPDNPSGRGVRNNAEQLSKTAWFSAATPAPTDRTFYKRFTAAAEELLFAHLPWTEACLGDPFVVEARDGGKPRTRRHLYVRAEPLALEISVSAQHPDLRGKAAGTPLWVKSERSTETGRVQVHRIRLREGGAAYDVASELIGVVDHVNGEKGVVHFVVSRGVHGTWPLADLRFPAKPGTAVAVRLACQQGPKGTRTRVLSIAPTTRRPAEDVCKLFKEEVEVTDNGLGFTDSGIFIPPHIVRDMGITDGDIVEGLAILNYEKKRDKWGMKAQSARVVGARPA